MTTPDNNTANKDGTFPDQHVSYNKKQQKDWYIPSINYVIEQAMNSDDKSEVINNINAANGIVDEETINYVLQAYGKKTSKQARFPNHIRDIDIITPIKERYLGEYIKQYHNYQVYVTDSDAVFKRNEELYKAISTELMAKFEELLNGKENALQDLDVEKFAEDFIEDWTDDRAIQEQERLDLINDVTESVIKYIEGFFYWFSTEQVYSYRTVINDDLIKEIIPPWEYYRVDSGNLFVEDDDMGCRKYYLSINQIKEKFGDELTKSDIEYLEILTTRATLKENDNTYTQQIFNRVVDVNGFDPQTYREAPINVSPNDYSSKIVVYHAVWKTQTKIYNLKYRDFETGEIKEMDVPETYKLNEAAGDISKEVEWVNEAWEGHRIGNKYEGIYIQPNSVEVQRPEINNNNSCKLPYNGVVGLIPFNESKPIPRRLIPYQHLLKVYHFQREKAIAKFKSFNLMPESILQDTDNMTLEERFNYASIDDILPYKDDDIEPHVLQGIKTLYNQGAERYIQILSEVISSLRSEAMDVSNMNEQRFGDINERAGKSTTEYAITKATTGSVLLFEMFNKFRERDYMADLDWSKAAWIDGKQGSYIDPETKNVVYVNIDGITSLGTNVGVFIKNSAIEEEKLKSYRELAFSAAQNGDLSIAAEAISSDNASKLKQLIKEAEEKREEFEKAERIAKERMEKEKTQREVELKKMELDSEASNTKFKEYADTQRTLAQLDVKLEEIEKKFATEENSEVIDEYKQELDRAKQRLADQKYELDRFKTIKQAEQQKTKESKS